MTSDRVRKRKIRARMAVTGETYTTAAQALDHEVSTGQPQGSLTRDERGSGQMVPAEVERVGPATTTGPHHD